MLCLLQLQQFPNKKYTTLIIPFLKHSKMKTYWLPHHSIYSFRDENIIDQYFVFRKSYPN